jgi:hypothetical protein
VDSIGDYQRELIVKQGVSKVSSWQIGEMKRSRNSEFC